MNKNHTATCHGHPSMTLLILLGAFLLAHGPGQAQSAARSSDVYVRVSPRDPRYFELTDGRPYIPIGLNMIAPPSSAGWTTMTEWIRKLSDQGGNFIRIWLSSPYFDIEHQRSGAFDLDKAERIDLLLEQAARNHIRVKMCLEHFRDFNEKQPAWSSKPLHLISRGGTATNVADFFNGEKSREHFRQKLRWYAEYYGNNPNVFGWELWNEINAVQAGDYMAWTDAMLPELKRLFPSNLVMQSLGSYDTERVSALYQRLAVMRGNEVAQVHRYLDLGASLKACQGPVDILAADAVRTLLASDPGRPVLLAESGAVEPRHTGPFKLYEKDRAGMILHDVLFAPFFSGAAGPGHIWHWDHYVSKNNLWHHFGRFAEAVKNIDPAAERFAPFLLTTARLRIYGLRGQQNLLLWCRDSRNDWQSELRDGKSPETVSGETLPDSIELGDLNKARISYYDPWQNRWSQTQETSRRIRLPDFQRSLAVRIQVP